MNNSRRLFIKNMGIGLTSTIAGSSILSSCLNNTTVSKGKGPFANIGIQLYTLRDLLAEDAKLTIETVAKIGFSHVETFGLDQSTEKFWGLSIEDLRKILDDNNLKSYSGHYDLQKYLDKNNSDQENIEKYIEVAHKLGQKYITAPVPPMGDLNNLAVADYQYAADQLNKAGEMAKKAGIKMAYHNHFWEFRSFPNGTKGLDILLAFTEPDLVAFELDLFWVEKSGINPISYFNKYPGRFHLWHIKDMDRSYTKPVLGEPFDTMPLDSITSQEVKFAEVGSGAIDFRSIISEAPTAGLEYAFVEQDEIYMSNKFESVKKSYDYVQKNLIKGK